jgi:very-short-patch-repair endonuclease
MSGSRITIDQLPARYQNQVAAQMDAALAAKTVKVEKVEEPKAPKAKREPARYDSFVRLLANTDIPSPTLEYRFHETRKWRFDFAWPDKKIALEVEGAVWTGGRHTRGSGFIRDMEKYNSAAMRGWRVVRCTPQTISAPETLTMLRELLK